MDSVYPALSGALAQEKRLEMITNNLANVSTSGFKKDFALFEGLTPKVDALTHPIEEVLLVDATYGTLVDIVTDFSAGDIQVTNEPLDIAIQGEGFFGVQSPNGVQYTRSGHFTLDAAGQVVTMQGYPVLGGSGPIILPSGQVTIQSDGTLFVNEVGADPVEIDQIPIYVVSDPSTLEKVGGNLFTVTRGQAIQSLEASLQQGALEGSNVNPVEEMVAMIDVMRLYEAAQKAIQTADTIQASASNDIGAL